MSQCARGAVQCAVRTEPSDRRLRLALLHFNVGLELGQLMIVGAATAVLFNVRAWSRYRQIVIRGGSMLALRMAAQRFIERTAYVSFMPF